MRWLLLPLPLLAPILIHLVYQPINANWTVRRFGCGCPPVRDTGAWRFNANHFNMLLWLIVFSACAWCFVRIVSALFPRRRSVLLCIGLPAMLYICLFLLAREGWL